MIKYSIIIVIGLLVISSSAYGQNNKKAKYWIEISQRNVMTGKSGIYRVKNNRIKRFIQHNEGIVFAKVILYMFIYSRYRFFKQLCKWFN